MRYLEAIEANDYKRLPGGIFNKSFIKAYARFISYNEQEALEGYIRTAREQGESPDEVASTPYQPRVYTDGSTRSPLVTLLLVLVILAILTLSVIGGLHWYQRRQANHANNNAPAPEAQTNQAAQTNAPPVSSNAPARTAATGLNVQVKARNETVWIGVRVDNAVKAEYAGNLERGNTKEFKAEQRLSIQFSKVKLNALELSINGRPAKVPPDMRGNLAEVVITKDNYEKFLQ